MMTKEELDILNGKSNVNSQQRVPFPECRQNTDAKRYLTHKLNRIINNTKSQIDRDNKDCTETYKFKERSIDKEIKKAREDVRQWKKEQAFTHHMTRWFRQKSNNSTVTSDKGSGGGESSCHSSIRLPPISNARTPQSSEVSGTKSSRILDVSRPYIPAIKETSAVVQEHKNVKQKLRKRNKQTDSGEEKLLLDTEQNLDDILGVLDNHTSSKKPIVSVANNELDDSLPKKLTLDPFVDENTENLEHNITEREENIPSIIYEIKFLSSMGKRRKKKKSTFLDRNYKENNDRLIHQYLNEQRQYNKRTSAENKFCSFKF